MLEKTLESPWDCKEIQPVHSKGDLSWVFFGRTDTEAEIPVLWPLHVKSWLIGKDSDAGRDWGQEEKGTAEDEMAGWHHRLNGHEFEWTPGVGDGQGGLVCCNSWGHRVRHDWATELNWTFLGTRKSLWLRDGQKYSHHSASNIDFFQCQLSYTEVASINSSVVILVSNTRGLTLLPLIWLKYLIPPHIKLLLLQHLYEQRVFYYLLK